MVSKQSNSLKSKTRSDDNQNSRNNSKYNSSPNASENRNWQRLISPPDCCSPVSSNTIQKKNLSTSPATNHPASRSSTLPLQYQKHVESRSAGKPLVNEFQRSFLPYLGDSINSARVHDDSQSRKSADAINAKAFTYKNHIFLGSGQSQYDKRLMAHEATHVSQQTGTGKGAEKYPANEIQRDPNDESEARIELSHPRFANDYHLDRIANGDIDQLSSRQNGRNRAVSKVQSALRDMGFDLPLHQADARFGDETRMAIQQFRSRYLYDDLDILDAEALIRLDQVAPALDEQQEHYFNYARLFEDNRLTVTVAFGHADTTTFTDETVSDVDVGTANAQLFREWLEGENFNLALLGLESEELWEKTLPITFPKGDGTMETKDIRVLVTLIEPGSGAASAYSRGLASSEVAMYNGHARYGSGPDFDEKSSPTENFRIGIDSAMAAAGRRTRYEEARRHHVVMDAEHDLQNMVNSGDFDPDQYRVLFFQACTSMAYLDEVRSEMGGTENIDVIGSRVPTLFTRDTSRMYPTEMVALLSGILQAQTAEQIVAVLEQNQANMRHLNSMRRERRGIFTTSGLGDNEIAP